MTALVPTDEEARLATLDSLNILDTLPEREFDDLVEIARALLDVPIALVSLVDRDRQWFKARSGLEACETSRDLAFCAHAILKTEPLVVLDATLDPRFADNPLVMGDFGLRFYAGAPIVVEEQAVGTVCALDHRPRQIDVRQVSALRALAGQAAALLAARLRAARFAESERRFVAFLEHAPVTAFLKDEAGRMRFVGRGFDRVYAEPSVLGRLDADWLPPAVVEEIERHDSQVRETGETISFEQHVPLADGTPQVGQSHKFPIEAEGGAWLGGVAVDVTAQGEIEETARRQAVELARRDADLEDRDAELSRALESAEVARFSAIRFEHLFDGLPVACYTHDLEGTIFEWNGAAEALWAMRSEEACGRSVDELVDEANQESKRATVARVFAGESVVAEESCITTAAGETRWLMTNTFPLRGPSGAIVGAVSANVDVTERRRMEESVRASEERIKTVLDSLHEGVVVQDALGRVTMSNRSAERILGMGREKLDLRSDEDPRTVAFREDGSEFPIEERPVARAIRDGRPHEAIIGRDTPEGERRWVSVIAVPMPSADGGPPTTAVASFLDVTERLRMESALRASEERFRTVVESLHEGLVVQDAEGQVLLWNPSAARVFNVEVEDTNPNREADRKWRLLREDGMEYALDEQPIAVTLRTGEPQVEAIMGVEFPGVPVRWLSINCSPLASAAGGPTTAVSSFVDITERVTQERSVQAHLTQIEAYSQELEAANGRLEALATTDGLTGLKNHRFFQDSLRRKIEQCGAAGFPLSLALLDVDRFKLYNDDFGHQAGDAVLRGVAEMLGRSARTTDLVARYGGEEFVILMPGLDEAGALAMADRMRERLAATPFKLRAVTASFGVATLGEDQPDAERLIRAADEALYRSKAAGRNRATHWGAGNAASTA